jgi:hypothetical protein
LNHPSDGTTGGAVTTLRHQKIDLLHNLFLYTCSRSHLYNQEAYMSNGRLYENDLAKLWRVCPSTIAKWRSRGLLVSDSSRVSSDGPHWYLYSTINEIHRKGLGNLSKQFGAALPSVEALVQYERQSGKPAVLLAAEACTPLHLSPHQLYRAVRAGRVPGIKLPGGDRLNFFAPLINEQVGQFVSELPPYVTLELAEKILGIGGTALSELYAEGGELKRVTDERNPLRVLIELDSLDTYLERHLQKDSHGNPFLTPAAWRALRRAHGYDELLTIADIKTHVRAHGRLIRAKIADGTLACLRTVGNQARIPWHSVKRWDAQR